MNPQFKMWLLVGGILAAAGGFVMLLKWLERKGWVNLSGVPQGTGSGTGAFQEFVEPGVKHVEQVREQKHKSGAPGSPPNA